MSEKSFSQSASKRAFYKLVKTPGKYLVVNSNNNCIGQIDNNTLKDSLKLFDEVILKPNNYAKITYIKDGDGWKLEKGRLSKEWDIKIHLKDSKC